MNQIKTSSTQKKDLITEFFKLTIGHLPRKKLTHIAGWLAHQKRPTFMAKYLVKWFQKKFDINLNEATKSLHEYQCVADLFTRDLKPHLRPISAQTFIHPVDGKLIDGGLIYQDQLFQAKNQYYSLSELIDNTSISQKLIGGRLLTYYLSPQDYHHIHAPTTTTVITTKKLGHDLWPVNQWSLLTHAKVFIHNERVVIQCQLHQKDLFIILVGAVVVGQILLHFSTESSAQIKKGQRIGTFNMGSTVILIYGPGLINENQSIESGSVKFGEALFLENT